MRAGHFLLGVSVLAMACAVPSDGLDGAPAGAAPPPTDLGTRHGYAYWWTPVVSTYAGAVNQPGFVNGARSAARFNQPFLGEVDSSGTLLVVDWGNNAIRKISPQGEVSTLAGLPDPDRDGDGFPDGGFVDGNGSAARFLRPRCVTVDGQGNAYVGDTGNNVIRKISPQGGVSTLAGWADPDRDGDGYADGGYVDAGGGDARFNRPRGVAVDGAGNVFVSDSDNHVIRKVTPQGVVTTWAGRAGEAGHVDGTLSDARFRGPCGMAWDGAGALYIAECGNHDIRKISAAGIVTTLAGRPDAERDGNGAPIGGYADGPASVARFKGPVALAVDDKGNVYVADYSNQAIRKVTPEGVVTTFAGRAAAAGDADGVASAARFSCPAGVVTDRAGGFYVADRCASTIRRIE